MCSEKRQSLTYFDGISNSENFSVEDFSPGGFDPSVISSTGSNNNNSQAEMESARTLPLESLHYVSVPIALKFRPTSKMSLNIGLQASYLVNYFNYALQNESWDADLSIQSNRSSARKVSGLDQYLNQFDLAGTLGVSYYPCDQLGLDLRYNRGLLDYTRDGYINGINNDYNNTFQLSLIYYFGRILKGRG